MIASILNGQTSHAVRFQGATFCAYKLNVKMSRTVSLGSALMANAQESVIRILIHSDVTKILAQQMITVLERFV